MTSKSQSLISITWPEAWHSGDSQIKKTRLATTLDEFSSDLTQHFIFKKHKQTKKHYTVLFAESGILIDPGPRQWMGSWGSSPSSLPLPALSGRQQSFLKPAMRHNLSLPWGLLWTGHAWNTSPRRHSEDILVQMPNNWLPSVQMSHSFILSPFQMTKLFILNDTTLITVHFQKVYNLDTSQPKKIWFKCDLFTIFG